MPFLAWTLVDRQRALSGPVGRGLRWQTARDLSCPQTTVEERSQAMRGLRGNALKTVAFRLYFGVRQASPKYCQPSTSKQQDLWEEIMLQLSPCNRTYDRVKRLDKSTVRPVFAVLVLKLSKQQNRVLGQPPDQPYLEPLRPERRQRDSFLNWVPTWEPPKTGTHTKE